MIRSAVPSPTGLVAVEGKVDPAAIWIDLTEPTKEERAAVEAALAITLPSRVRMRAIEPSSRLVAAGDLLMMTYTGLARDPSDPGVPVTCLLKGNRLVTIKAVEAEPFDTTREQACQEPGLEAHDVFVMLVAESVEDIADRLEALSAEIDRVTAEIFDADEKARRSRRRNHRVMRALGRLGTQLMRLQDSLTSLHRLGSFIEQHRQRIAPQLEDQNATASLSGDIHALSEFAETLDAKIEFLLDAMLGLIALDQNQIMMMLSLMAAMFLPATLISSIFGMNFAQMPGLTWNHGFLLSLLAMVFAAILVGAVFRWRRWM